MDTLYSRLKKEPKEVIDRVPNSATIEELKKCRHVNSLTLRACVFILNCISINTEIDFLKNIKNQFKD